MSAVGQASERAGTDDSGWLRGSLAKMKSIEDRIAEFDRAMTVEEVAALFALHPDTIYKQARRGAIPCFRVGKAVRFDPWRLLEWYKKVTIRG